jgi:hypothetical protein
MRVKFVAGDWLISKESALFIDDGLTLEIEVPRQFKDADQRDTANNVAAAAKTVTLTITLLVLILQICIS